VDDLESIGNSPRSIVPRLGDVLVMNSAEDYVAVLDEIRLAIVEAVREGDVIRVDNIANFIATAYPLSQLTVGEISVRIIEAAFHAGVQVELRSSSKGDRSVRLSMPEPSPGNAPDRN
jgi:hypothetical protein